MLRFMSKIEPLRGVAAAVPEFEKGCSAFGLWNAKDNFLIVTYQSSSAGFDESWLLFRTLLLRV